ncbi:hypothetical protein TWF281_005024 [Arthrobotrys megalospora]
MTEPSEASSSPPSFTIGELVIGADPQNSQHLTGSATGSSTNQNQSQDSESRTNVHDRFPQELRDQFQEQYHTGFHGGFRRQAEIEFSFLFPVDPDPPASITVEEPEGPGDEVVPQPPSDENQPPNVGLALPFDEQNLGEFNDPRNLTEEQNAIAVLWSQFVDSLSLEDASELYEYLSEQWGPPLDQPEEGHSEELPDLSYPEMDSRNEESYQDAVEYHEPMEGGGNIDDIVYPMLFEPMEIDEDINTQPNLAPSNIEQSEPMEGSYLEEVDPQDSYIPRYHHLPHQELDQDPHGYFFGFNPSNENNDEDVEMDDGSISPVLYELVPGDMSQLIYKNLSNFARLAPNIMIDPKLYLGGPGDTTPSTQSETAESSADDNDADTDADADDELGDTPQPPRMTIKIKFKPPKDSAVSQKLKINFKRSIDYRQEIRAMQRDGRYKDADEVKLVGMEIKFIELQELADDVWNRMKASLVLHADLFYGVVGFSRWSVEGRCPDVELFDMLMSFNLINNECERRTKATTGEEVTRGSEAAISFVDIVEKYNIPERRIDCHEFSSQIFPLPIKYITASKLRPESPDSDSSSSEDEEDLSLISNTPVAALAFMGKVAIRFNRKTGEFTFSGLYHFIRFGGRNPTTIDFHKHQKDGSPFAPGSGGTGSRYHIYGSSSRRPYYGRVH